MQVTKVFKDGTTVSDVVQVLSLCLAGCEILVRSRTRSKDGKRGCCRQPFLFRIQRDKHYSLRPSVRPSVWLETGSDKQCRPAQLSTRTLLMIPLPSKPKMQPHRRRHNCLYLSEEQGADNGEDITNIVDLLFQLGMLGARLALNHSSVFTNIKELNVSG